MSLPKTWSETRVERLKALDEKGWSMAQIARDLSHVDPECGPVTRNAVVGKLNRLRGKKYITTRPVELYLSPWTEARKELLLEQERAGSLTHVQKAEALNEIDRGYGRITAHAVSLKLQNMRPQWIARGDLPGAHRPRLGRPGGTRRARRALAIAAPEPTPETAKPFLKLDDGQCRWVLNDPKAPEGAMACGARTVAATYDGAHALPSRARSFCPHHFNRSTKLEN
ncbi:hypothetical protein AUC70_11850 [Methyloceanibacter stevinii]|uniref:GcrA cell cycle regulator n=1 Tax=Methyloceanibacter stevinii TaxID=1774970 RepID=A0A1E3VJ51_9HYPH|nr:GcrA family cell cycle regulator [Methyloceanibacter stevinii]ODR93549.1 hypothetical protein AUC70_11850 [Methyloceanibacter stevinii]